MGGVGVGPHSGLSNLKGADCAFLNQTHFDLEHVPQSEKRDRLKRKRAAPTAGHSVFYQCHNATGGSCLILTEAQS